MGWTSYHASFYKNGKIDRKAECDSIMNCDMVGNKGRYEVLKSAMAKTYVLRSGTAMLTILYQKLNDGYTLCSIPPDAKGGIASRQTPLYSTPKIILTKSWPKHQDVLIVSILRTGIYIITILNLEAESIWQSVRL